MPPRTRALRGSPPDTPVSEESRQEPQRAKSTARRQKVYGRHKLGRLKQTRQETLTQIGFVNTLTDREIDAEIEEYEREREMSSKRRKTVTPSSRFYTQTLTQLDFSSTVKAECRDSEEEEDEDDDDVDEEQDGAQVETEVDERIEHVSESPVPRKRRPQHRGGIITVRCIKVEPDISPSPPLRQSPNTSHKDPTAQNPPTKPAPSLINSMPPPPKTPTHKRTLEVPSSQSPTTPLSTQSISQSLRTYDERSPLKPRSSNLVPSSPRIPSSLPIAKLSSPPPPPPQLRQSQISTQAITQTQTQTQEDPHTSLVPDSSPVRQPQQPQPHPSSRTAPSTQSPSAQVLSEFSAVSSPTPTPKPLSRHRDVVVGAVKTEIADSEADSDDDDGDEIESLSLPAVTVATTTRAGVQVRSSPEDVLLPRRRLVLSSSPLLRPALGVGETVREDEGGYGDGDGDELGSQWTRSQLLPESLMMDSLLALPPVLGGEWDE